MRDERFLREENEYYSQLQVSLQEKINMLDDKQEEVVKSTKEVENRSEQKLETSQRKLKNLSDRALSNASDMVIGEERLSDKKEQRG